MHLFLLRNLEKQKRFIFSRAARIITESDYNIRSPTLKPDVPNSSKLLCTKLLIIWFLVICLENLLPRQ